MNYDVWFKSKIQKAKADPQPPVSHARAMAGARTRIEATSYRPPTPMILFLDFDGVLHPLWEPAPFNDWQLKRTFGPHPWQGPFFIHAPILVELLRPYLDQIEIVISSTWGRKRDLDTLRGLLPPELAARVTDAVHNRLPPLEDAHRGHDLTSRWAEIAFYRELARPDIGDRWLAIDDDDLGWPDSERHHLAHCANDLGSAEAKAAVAQAVKDWLTPGKFPAPPVMVGVQADRLERFIAHDPLGRPSGRTYEASSADQLIGRLRADGIDPARVEIVSEGPHAPSSIEAEAIRIELAK